MPEPASRSLEERVLVLAPTAKDARFCQAILSEAGMLCRSRADVSTVCREVGAGAGAAVLTEEALTPEGFERLLQVLGQQPAWSDVPLLILTREGADSPVALRTLELLGNVVLLERPVRVPTLVSAVRTALRARKRQYQIREQLAETRRSAETLRKADRHKDEFLATLAHELRNPLSPCATLSRS